MYWKRERGAIKGMLVLGAVGLLSGIYCSDGAAGTATMDSKEVSRYRKSFADLYYPYLVAVSRLAEAVDEGVTAEEFERRHSKKWGHAGDYIDGLRKKWDECAMLRAENMEVHTVAFGGYENVGKLLERREMLEILRLSQDYFCEGPGRSRERTGALFKEMKAIQKPTKVVSIEEGCGDLTLSWMEKCDMRRLCEKEATRMFEEPYKSFLLSLRGLLEAINGEEAEGGLQKAGIGRELIGGLRRQAEESSSLLECVEGPEEDILVRIVEKGPGAMVGEMKRFLERSSEFLRRLEAWGELSEEKQKDKESDSGEEGLATQAREIRRQHEEEMGRLAERLWASYYCGFSALETALISSNRSQALEEAGYGIEIIDGLIRRGKELCEILEMLKSASEEVPRRPKVITQRLESSRDVLEDIRGYLEMSACLRADKEKVYAELREEVWIQTKLHRPEI
jgi:hypothetical protein